MLLNIDQKPSLKAAVIDSLGEMVNYGDLCSFVRRLETELPLRSLVFLGAKNDVGGVAWAMALIASKNIPLIINSALDEDLSQNLRQDYLPHYLCVKSSVVSHYDLPVVLEAFGYVLLEDSKAPRDFYPELSHLLPTSGSTGSPKLIRHCYDNIEAQGRNLQVVFDIKAEDRPLLVLPLYYTMGLSVVFSYLKQGATLLITDLSMLDPKFYQFIKEQRANSLTGVPYSYEILKAMRFERMDLPSLKILTQGGGHLNEKTNAFFVSWCQAHGVKWIATYGQSEGTARMAYLPSDYAESKLGSIGKAIPQGKFSLRSPEGEEILDADREGELLFQGPNVSLGYALERADLALGDVFKGVLLTGDLAKIDAEGFIYITGRKSRFLKLFGLRIGLDECENILKDNLNIPCACVGNDKRMKIYILEENKKKMVKDLLVQKTGLVASCLEVCLIDEIPKNAAGKTLYQQLAL